MNEWVTLPRPFNYQEHDEVHQSVISWFDRLSPSAVQNRTRIERFFLDYYTEEQAADYVAHMLQKASLDLTKFGLKHGMQVARIKREAYTTMDYLEFRITGIACEDQAKVITRIEAEDETSPVILAALVDKDQRVLDNAWSSLKDTEGVL